METTYSVRVQGVETRKNSAGKTTSHRVRWVVDGTPWKARFGTEAHANAFRAELLSAAKKGEAFDIATGRPVSVARKTAPAGPDWYTFALKYTAAKWPYASPNHRRGISESITDATEVLLSRRDGAPPRTSLRDAMRWATSTHIESPDAVPPDDLADAVAWLEKNTIPMTAFADPKAGTQHARAVLDRINRKQDGKLAAGATFLRKRAVLNNLMGYAIETGALTANPLKAVKWTKPKTVESVDARTVINTQQADRLLAEVAKQGEMGARLVAFFGCMYYAALRPEEAIGLMRSNLTSLPDTDDWGEMNLTESEPSPGKRWTDNATSRQRRALKHRAEGETRPVPIHPDLVRLLRAHLGAFPNANGYVFRGPRGGKISDSAYLPVFHTARARAFTHAERTSPLADVPYALRHAAVSTWLNSGVSATQVAEWAGHSVDVLLRVYAKCISGQAEDAKRRILEATRPQGLIAPIPAWERNGNAQP